MSSYVHVCLAEFGVLWDKGYTDQDSNVRLKSYIDDLFGLLFSKIRVPPTEVLVRESWPVR
jgi:hypothetical protein